MAGECRHAATTVAGFHGLLASPSSPTFLLGFVGRVDLIPFTRSWLSVLLCLACLWLGTEHAFKATVIGSVLGCFHGHNLGRS